MTRLRTHTKSHHQITITEYKERFGSELEPVEIVWHRYSVINYYMIRAFKPNYQIGSCFNSLFLSVFLK